MKSTLSKTQKSIYLFSILLVYTFSFSQSGCWKQVNAGGNTNIALQNDGVMWQWGYNGGAILNAPITTIITSPMSAPGIWEQVKLGEVGYGLGVKNDGTLWAWGLNYYRTGENTYANSIQNTPTQIGTDTWFDFSAGTQHRAGIKNDGTLWAWGDNTYGQLGNHFTWGTEFPVQVEISNDWKSVVTGSYHTVALKNDGTLWSWGFNRSGELGIGTLVDSYEPTQIGSSNDWKSVYAGGYQSFAIKTDGTLWGWGYNGLGQLGNGTTTSSIVTTPMLIGTANDWKEISTSNSTTVGIKNNNTLWIWGYFGTNNCAATPIQIGISNTWKHASAGKSYICAIEEDGSLWTMGVNSQGELGNGSFSQTPTTVLANIGCPSLNIDDFNDSITFLTYPNPTSNILHLETKQILIEKFELYDLQGRLIISEMVNNNQYLINISDLEAASYLVKIYTIKGTQNIKIIKN